LTASLLLDRAAALGVRVVQIADNLPLHHLDEEELDVLARQADRLGIDLEVGTCGIAPDRLLRYARIAARLKSPIVRTGIDTPGHEPACDEVVETLRSVIPDFERAGIDLAIENHDRSRAATLAELLDRVESPHVGLCLDTANSIGCVENVDTLVAVLGRRTVNVHMKDYRIFRPPHLKGFVVEGCPAGRGQLDIPRLLEAIRACGRDPNVIVELWPSPEATLAESIAKEEDWACESIRYLRPFIPD
jgi:sugar phosphate isomerase/epimerase